MRNTLFSRQLCKSVSAVLVIWMSLPLSAMAMVKQDRDYLPADIEYNESIPMPSSVLGTQVGEWHARHDQLEAYMRVLADASPRVSLIETGRTHANRALLQLRITSPENQPKLTDIQQSHMQVLSKGEKPKQDAPLIIYMGYGVHGNEPSASNSSLLVAYYLAAAESEDVKQLLDENVVLLDPVLNPDGFSRFAAWANMHRGKTLNSDRDHREHLEGWPSGRTNYYWFDLNRDWLLLTHPESRARIKQFHAWRPHILTDFHEMGTDSTYFFQPGVPSRKHPLTPQSNVTLTAALAEYHAAALDAEKKLYFSEESFDDFYYGKGSTYPDAHGSIGILFEQARTRGHVHESINGEMTFADTIQNQVTMSLSTFAGALANKQAILAYQKQFYDETAALIKQDKTSGYIIKATPDTARLAALTALLEQHQIAFGYTTESKDVESTTYPIGSVYVSLDQSQYRLIKSLFSTQTSFADNTFYDVSSWNLPMAFDLGFSAVDRGDARRLKLSETLPAQTERPLFDDAYAYAFEWHHYKAPALLSQLLDAGIQARLSGSGFTATTTTDEHGFAAGTVVIPMGLAQPDNTVATIKALSEQYAVPIFSITSGLTSSGIDLGSRQLEPIERPRIALIGGRGTSEYEVGEIWHYLDTRMDTPVSIIEQWRVGQTDLSQYSHIVLANGNYSGVSKSAIEAIGDWLLKGGVLIGQKRGAQWLAENKWLNAEFMPSSEVDKLFDTSELQFGDRQAHFARKLIAGTVFMTEADMTHPLLFGVDDAEVPMFKTSNAAIRPIKEPFIVPFRYTEAPLKSGYADLKLADLIAETPAVVAHRVGQGRVIGFVDNMNFRGYWYGTSKLFANAIFMSNLIDAR